MASGPRSGDVIAGRYRLDQVLGQGGQGSVWRADHVTLGSPVAVKLLDATIADNADAVARFLREAQAAAALRSPHVVQILDHGMDGAIPYIAMEMLDGESLQQRLDRERVLSPTQTMRIIAHVCRAMGRAHEAGIVHRDLKPGNIFLVKNDDEEIAKVLDFGIAKVQSPTGVAASAQTRTGALLGTPFYMSPEQARGKLVDARSDLWSVAIIVFECLLGRVPFRGDSIGDLVIEICTDPMPKPSSMGPVPFGFDLWFERATARDPTRRFQSARELADSLRAALERAQASTVATEVGLGPRADAPTVTLEPTSQPGALPSLFTTNMEEAATAAGESSAGGAVVRVSHPRIDKVTVLSSATVTDGGALADRGDRGRGRWPFVGLAAAAVLGAALVLAFRSPAPSTADEVAATAAHAPSAPAATEAASVDAPAPPPPTPAATAAEPTAQAAAESSARAAGTPAPSGKAVAAPRPGPKAAPKPTATPAPAAPAAPARPKEDLGL